MFKIKAKIGADSGYVKLSKELAGLLREMMCEDQTRYAINRVQWDGKNLVATDGRRLLALEVSAENIPLNKGVYILTKEGFLLEDVEPFAPFPKWRDLLRKKSDEVEVACNKELEYGAVGKGPRLLGTGILFALNRVGAEGVCVAFGYAFPLFKKLFSLGMEKFDRIAIGQAGGEAPVRFDGEFKIEYNGDFVDREKNRGRVRSEKFLFIVMPLFV